MLEHVTARQRLLGFVAEVIVVNHQLALTFQLGKSPILYNSSVAALCATRSRSLRRA
jgi:hypothetical protein